MPKATIAMNLKRKKMTQMKMLKTKHNTGKIFKQAKIPKITPKFIKEHHLLTFEIERQCWSKIALTEQAAMAIGVTNDQRAYQCPNCHMWHLTSRK